ncbi:MAG: dihydrolipoyllysine-residue succinyltransferase [Gemmatimonadota bacterium]
MDITIPPLAESITEGDIGAWLVKSGDRVVKDQAVLELETDKATVEIAAEASGTVEILVAAGETVQVGDVVGRIAEGEGAAEATPEPVEPEPEPAQAPAPEPPPAAEPTSPPESTQPPEPVPVVKAEPPPAAPKPAAGAVQLDAPGTRREKMTRLRQRIAERMVEAQRTAAILTTFNEIDMTGVLELRKEHQEDFEARHGVKLGFMSLFGRASILALRDFPEINAYIEGIEVVYHDYVNLGIAVGTPRGLVVPVLRNADRMSFAEMELAIKELATRARDGELSIEELQGGTFTISNGGIYGSLMSTPILNPPQSGILGMHKIERRPVVLDDGPIVARPLMYVALSYDHRIVDGEQAVTFLVRIKERLEDPTRLLLDS